jgi:uncharacterized protein YjiS (DUF1127 family)
MASARIGASYATLAGRTTHQPVHFVPPGLLTYASEQVLAWLERARQRRQLQRLSEHMLKDIGLSRADVEVEVAKPFWRQ